ncbi:tail assembly protein [Moraxella catarrhalis]|uniref:Bacteriophage lambda tail assembly I family protein n=1 Tax=Moraxella catarrhalis TaxID=480 RepID=A0A3Q9GHG4_MORCA|nr:tail assembly protein [Moraxella catarrhalis]AZQ94375.1 bacteriophage lambda tail assembly I family protein [Moraxella catarrhalis]MCG6834337.1 tail assembly protein [Moraxella catarrhalis]RKL71075.1 tail assembly protein [Moraxella catarrhalis]
MKTIQLHGILAKKFGRFFKLDVKSAKEACHALATQIPAFGQFMADSEQLGYRFAVFNGKKQNQKTNIGENQLNDITTANHIHIVPKVIGSGGKALGWIQVVVGVALIATGVGAGIGAGLTLSAAVAANIGMIGAGAGLLLGGVSALMMPTPKLDVANEDGNKPNNGFGGAITTVAQGNPVPILYGERDVGGFIVSAGISV